MFYKSSMCMKARSSCHNSCHSWKQFSFSFLYDTMSFLSVVCFIVAVSCKFDIVKSSIDSFQFDVNDILNEKFMPANLVAMELKSFIKGSSNITRAEFYKPDNTSCNFTTAFSTMGFHRKMMNEYLATNFLAKQILSEFPLDNVSAMERRMGAVAANTTNDTTVPNSGSNHRQGKFIQNEMLEDPGSASYRSWLDKTTTLDDIQRQFQENNNAIVNEFKPLQREAEKHRKSADNDDDGLEEEDFDEGDITGYAYSGGVMDSAPSYPQAMPPPRHHLPFDATNNILHMQPVSPTAGSKNGYYPPSAQENSYENYGQPMHHVQAQPQQQIKEIGLKDIFDIVLTTLAFLSFGMFILQVLMCITMNKEDTSSMMMMPMEAPNTGTMVQTNNDGSIEEIRRRKRNLPENRRMQMMNELSRRVLNSIDAVLLIPKDEGRCHYQSLCENNKFARQQQNGQKVWIPMWSLGISWLSSKVSLSNTTTGSPILESLKASVIGLGNGDCAKIYSSCQMEIIADGRKRKERRIQKRDLWNLKRFDWKVPHKT